VIPVSRVAIRAPAKLNLGLAVLGRRSDGFHEILTILQAIGRYDDLALALDVGRPGVWIDGDDPAAAREVNLALMAAERLRETTTGGESGGLRLALTKRIPVAAGLGGASSDAAAALLGTRRLLALDLADDALAEVAGGLGSDVPFFLLGGTALAAGRGEDLSALPTPPDLWFVVVAPPLAQPIARKTASLYAALGDHDFGDGADVRAQAVRLQAGEPLDPELLGNAFARPLLKLRPELNEIQETMRRVAGRAVALSGAGPSHYVSFNDPEAAADLAGRLAEWLPRATVFAAAALTAGRVQDMHAE